MKSYFTFLFRNKIYSAIEIFGLSIALGFVLFLASYAHSEYNVGNRFGNGDKIFTVGFGDFLNQPWGAGNHIYSSIAEIEEYTRCSSAEAMGSDAAAEIGDQHFEARFMKVDPNFFSFFPYSVEGGDAETLLKNNSNALISRSFAHKVFGNEDPMGETIKIGQNVYQVTGIVEDFGIRDLFPYTDIIANMKTVENSQTELGNIDCVSFVKLTEGADIAAIEKKLAKKYAECWEGYTEEYNAKSSSFLWGSKVIPVSDIHFSTLEAYGLVQKDKKIADILTAIALVLLISALFNYVNLSVALTGKRAKEMTTRRLLGENVVSITFRYIGESFVFTAGCFVVGWLVAVLFTPLFNEYLSTNFSLYAGGTVFAWGGLLLILIAVITGTIPALFMLQFKPIDVVKGAFRFKSKMLFGKVFIVLQNVISTVLIGIGIAMLAQINYLATLPTGYNTRDMVIVRAMDIMKEVGTEPVKLLKDELAKLPEVEACGLARKTPNMLGHDGINEKIDGEWQTSWLISCELDSTAFSLFGFEILEQYSEPREGMLWIAEETRRRYNVSPEKPFFGDQGNGEPQHTVCGIIRSYRSGNALDKPKKDSHIAIEVHDPDYHSYQIVLKVHGNKKLVLDAIRMVNNRLTKKYLGAERELDTYYIEDRFMEDLNGTRNTMMLTLWFMIISTLISSLGLFAMSLYFTEQKSRNLAICKIFGSDVIQSVWSLSRNFLVLSVIAIVIAAPITIWAIERYLTDFVHQLPTYYWIVVVASLFSLIVACVSIFGNVVRVAMRNPVENLKAE